VIVMLSIIFLFSITNPTNIELIEEVKVPVCSEEILEIKTFGNYTYFLCDYKILREGNGIVQFGTFGMESGELVEPISMDIEAGWLYILDYGSRNIKIFDRDGNYIDEREIKSEEPVAIAVSNERTFILDPLRYKIDVYGEESLLYSFGNFGKGPGFMNNPVDMDVTSGKVYILEKNRISVFSEYGDFIDMNEIKEGKTISADKYVSVSTDSTTLLFDQNVEKIKSFEGEISATEGNNLFIFNDSTLWKYVIEENIEGQ
jgi:hypothetical protein